MMGRKLIGLLVTVGSWPLIRQYKLHDQLDRERAFCDRSDGYKYSDATRDFIGHVVVCVCGECVCVCLGYDCMSCLFSKHAACCRDAIKTTSDRSE